MEKYAHINDKGKKQPIKDHLCNTAELARNNAVEDSKDMAYAIGMIHDIGKYADAFQDRLNGGKGKFEHSACGAIEYRKCLGYVGFAPMMEFCIACHHTGLQDGGAGLMEGTMLYRISQNREKEYTGNRDYSEYKDEISLIIPDLPKVEGYFKKFKSRDDLIDFIELYAFFTRYLFACLVDADFIETENFCRPGVRRGLQADFAKAGSLLSARFNKMPSDTNLRVARSRIQKQAYENVKLTLR